jgi:hypothetical protein
MRRALTLTAALVALAGCTKDRTEAVVVVNTAGVRVPDDIDFITLTVADAGDVAHPIFTKKLLLCGGAVTQNCMTLPLNFTLIPGVHLDHSSRVQVTAQRGSADVIDDAAVFTFAEGQSLRLDFVLYANCIGNTDCAKRDQACGPDAMCQNVPVVPIHGDPDLGSGGGGGGDDLASGTTDDLSMPGDLSSADLALPGGGDMAVPLDMTLPLGDMACKPLCVAGSCGLSSCGTPCLCSAGEVCDTTMTCQPADMGSTGGPDQVLTWTERTFDGGLFNGIWGLTGRFVVAVGNFAGSSAVFMSTDTVDPLNFVPDPRFTSMGTLYGVSGRSPNDVYVVGPSGVVVHFDGSTWSDAGAGIGSGVGVNGVWVGGPGDDVWAVGGNVSSPGNDPYGFAHHSTAMFPTGTHWSTTTGTGRALQGAWGDGAGFVIAVADETSILYSSNNSGFTGVSVAATNNPLYGVFGLSPPAMWAAGGNGTIWHLDYKSSTGILGSTKETLTPTTTASLFSVGGTTGDLWAVGANNSVYHSIGDGTWTRQTNLPTPDNFTSFHGVFSLGPNDVYVVGNIMGTKVILHGQ